MLGNCERCSVGHQIDIFLKRHQRDIYSGIYFFKLRLQLEGKKIMLHWKLTIFF
jgi:hypothetical protein